MFNQPHLVIVLLITVLIYLSILPETKSDMYVSLKIVEELVDTEAATIKNIKKCLHRVSDPKKRSIVEKFLRSCMKEYRIAINDVEHYIGNPINAFRIVKRYYVDLMIVEELLKGNIYYTKSNVPYPTVEDFDGAAKGLIHLMVAYNLNVTEIVNGTLKSNISRNKKNFVEYVTPFTASDCYELGIIAHEFQEYTTSIALMTAAFEKYPQCDVCSFSEFDIVKFLSRTYYFMGRIEDFLMWTENSLSLKLTDQQMEESKRLIEHLKNSKHLNKTSTAKKDNMSQTYKPDKQQLCFEEGNTTINNKSLHCFYQKGPQPFVRLLSLKMEQLHLKPDVTITHDVITDSQIKTLKRDAGPMLEIGVVSNYIKNANIKVVGVAYVYDYSSKPSLRISSKLNFITGYKAKSDQELVIGNYGIGGFDVPHFDVKDDYKAPRICLKNKLTMVNPTDWQEKIGKVSCFMFLSDVEQGGAMIFPRLRVTVFPEKGAVVTWRNVRRSGRADRRVEHANCPVLRGYKWFGSKLL